MVGTYEDNSDFGSHFDVCIAEATGDNDNGIGELRDGRREKRQLPGMGTQLYRMSTPDLTDNQQRVSDPRLQSLDWKFSGH